MNTVRREHSLRKRQGSPLSAEGASLAGLREDRRAALGELRRTLRERFPEAHAGLSTAVAPAFLTGVPLLDQLPVRRGTVNEVVDGGSAGSGLLLHALLESCQARGCPVGLIDVADAFDPQSHGSDLCRRLLWVRCAGVVPALKAADLLLRDGNFPLLVMDMVLAERREVVRVPAHCWSRLQLLAQRSGAVLLAMSASPLISCAVLRLRVSLDSGLLDAPRRELVARLAVEVVRQRGCQPERVPPEEPALPAPSPLSGRREREDILWRKAG